MSFLMNLECTRCGERYEADRIHGPCIKCGSPLFARYDLKAIGLAIDRNTFKKRRPNMWRYLEFLPVQ